MGAVSKYVIQETISTPWCCWYCTTFLTLPQSIAGFHGLSDIRQGATGNVIDWTRTRKTAPIPTGCLNLTSLTQANVNNNSNHHDLANLCIKFLYLMASVTSIDNTRLAQPHYSSSTTPLNTNTNRIPIPQRSTLRSNRRIPLHQLLQRQLIQLHERRTPLPIADRVPLHARRNHALLRRRRRGRARWRRRRVYGCGVREHVSRGRRAQL